MQIAQAPCNSERLKQFVCELEVLISKLDTTSLTFGQMAPLSHQGAKEFFSISLPTIPNNSSQLELPGPIMYALKSRGIQAGKTSRR